MTAISTNKYIYNILSNDEIIKGYVSNKIYPLVAEESTTFPFIIFRKNNIQTEYTKDGRTFDIVDFSVTVVANDYITTVDVCERVRELIELYRNDYFKQIHLTNVTEDYIDNAYIQELQFTAKIK